MGEEVVAASHFGLSVLPSCVGVELQEGCFRIAKPWLYAPMALCKKRVQGQV